MARQSSERTTSWLLMVTVLLLWLAGASGAHAEGTGSSRTEALRLFAAGRYDAALPWIDAWLARHPHDIELLNKRGTIYLQANQPERALADFDEAARFSPFLAYDANGFQRQFAPDVARDLGATQYWAIQLFPSAFHNRGIAHLMLGRDDQALADFQHALDLRRSFPPATAKGRATYAAGQAASLGGIGQVYLRKHNPEQALDAFNEALRANPNDANAHVGRAQALGDLGQPDAALLDVDRALGLDSGHARARVVRSELLARLDRPMESLHELDTALRDEPDSVLLRRRRAAHQARLGQFDAALQELDAALRLNPNDAEVLKDRGGVRNQQGRPSEALGDLDRALQLDPGNARAYQNRAASFNALGRFAEAIRDADAALRLQPRTPGALNNRGLAKLALGQFPESVIDFTAAIEIDAKLAPAYLNRAGALTRLGRHDDAAADYAIAVRLEPRYAEIYRNPAAIPDLLRLPSANPAADTLAIRQDGTPAALASQPIRSQGDLCRAAGDWSGAVNAYTQALQATPADVDLLVLRGWARLIAGEPGAAADARAWFNRSGAGWRDPLAPSVALLGILAGRADRTDAVARQLLDEALANVRPDQWPAPILRYLARQLDSEALLAATSNREEQTLAYAVIGFDLSLRGYQDAAAEHLRWACENGPERSVPRDLARQLRARFQIPARQSR